ncbi:DUF3649 domain-containing protein [Kozakia baliensis]|uniref:DUF3649 domain-containing protein n=1 Tax=Kozakia baliensis TaxID=153496 RepID=UPI00345C5356
MMSAAARLRRYRRSVAARVAAGVLGGYVVASLVAVLLARVLPMVRLEAVITATLLGLLVWPPIVMACFYVRSARRAWFGVLTATAALGSAALLTGWRL